MGSKKFFFSDQKFFFLWAMPHWNYGEMTIKNWVELCPVFDHNFICYFIFYIQKIIKKVMLQLPNSPISHFHQQTHFAPNWTWTTFLWVASPACFHWATPCLLRKHQVYNISIKDTPFRVWISVCASKSSLKWPLKWPLKKRISKRGILKIWSG